MEKLSVENNMINALIQRHVSNAQNYKISSLQEKKVKLIEPVSPYSGRGFGAIPNEICVKDYCADPRAIYPLEVELGICVVDTGKRDLNNERIWKASVIGKDGEEICCYDSNKLKASAMVYLKYFGLY